MIEPIYLLVIFLGTWLSSAGAFFVKKGSERFKISFEGIIMNKWFMLGGMLYALSIPVYLYVLEALPVSIAYPLTSMNFIWVAFLSSAYLREKVDLWRWSGVFLVMIGIGLISA